MQKLISFLFIIFFFLSQNLTLFGQNSLDREIETIVNKLVKNLNNESAKNVAVTDFTNLNSAPTELGKYLAEEFSLALSSSEKSFSVIDRSRINFLLKEAGLDAKGLLDPNSVAKLGNLKGVDAVIIGTLTPSGNYIRLIVKAIKIETASIIAAAKGDISKTPTINDLDSKILSKESTKLSSQTSKSNKRKNPSEPPKKTEMVQSFDGWDFEFTGCRRAGNGVRCNFKVVSTNKDVTFAILGGGSMLYDNFGNVYRTGATSLANHHDKRNTYSASGMKLITNVTTKGSVTFNDISKEATKISLLEFSVRVDNLPGQIIQYRNIKL